MEMKTNIEQTHKIQEIQRLVRTQCPGIINSKIHVSWPLNQIHFEFILNDEKRRGYTITAEMLEVVPTEYIVHSILNGIPEKYFITNEFIATEAAIFPIGTQEHTDYITAQMKNMPIQDIIKYYNNLIVTKEQSHIIKKKIFELMYTKQQYITPEKLKEEVKGQFPEVNSYNQTPNNPWGETPKHKVLPRPKSVATTMEELVPALSKTVRCPCKCSDEDMETSLQHVIIHLNDTHHPKKVTRLAINDPWSRERIADWLESLDVDLQIKTPQEVTA